jgi:DNA-binding transcriptional LysR family regulator
MLDPLHLRTLTTVLQTGSFAAAARHLGYTPSAVSQQVAALERAARLPLFDRQARSIRPTPAAAFLSARGQEVLAALGALQDDLRSLTDGAIGTVRLGSFPTASEHLLPAALATLAVSHPSVEILLDEGEPDELTPRVHDGDLDVALVYRYTRVPVRRPRALRVTPLLLEDLVLIFPSGHPLAEAADVGLGDLEDAVWISTRHGSVGATSLQRICAEAGFEPRVSYRSNDYDVVRGLVRCGLGVALVPALGHVADPGVVARRLAEVTVYRHVEALARPAVRNPAVDGVVTALVAAAGALRHADRELLREAAEPRTIAGRIRG